MLTIVSLSLRAWGDFVDFASNVICNCEDDVEIHPVIIVAALAGGHHGRRGEKSGCHRNVSELTLLVRGPSLYVRIRF